MGLLDRFKHKPQVESQSNEVVLLKQEISELRTLIQKAGKAYDPNFTTWNIPSPGGDRGVLTTDRRGKLSYNELHEIYEKSSVIRAIIDGIVRTISSLNWRIMPVDEESEGKLDSVIKQVTKFFMNPNENSESFTDIIKKIVRDVLVYEESYLEKVKSKKGLFGEIYIQNPAYFKIGFDKHGIITGYTQQMIASNDKVEFKPNEIIFFRLYPNTVTHYGQPISETLVNEIAATMFATRLIAKSFELDEIPPGILNLGKIGQVAYDRAREYFKEMREGGKKDYAITVVHDTDKIEWIKLTRDFKELQLSELLDKINRMIFRAFGVTPTEMGSIEDVNRATARVQEDISRSHLIIPITRMLEEYLNSELVWSEFSPDVRFEFQHPKENDPRLNFEMANNLVHKGVLNINEARKYLGQKAIDGGDKYTLILGSQIFEVTGEGYTPLVEPPPLPFGFQKPFEEKEPKEGNIPEAEKEITEYLDLKEVKPKKSVSKREIFLYKADGVRKSNVEITWEYVTKFNPKTIDIQKALRVHNDAQKIISKLWKEKKGKIIKTIISAYPNIGAVKKEIDHAISTLMQPTITDYKKNMRPSYDDGIRMALKYDPKIELDQDAVEKKYDDSVAEDIKVIRDVLFYGDRGFYNQMLNKVKDYKDGNKQKETTKRYIQKQDEYDDLYDDLDEVFTAFVITRIPNYTIKSWAMAHRGMIEGLSQSDEKEFEKGWWVNTSGNVCKTCIELSQNSPYPLTDFPTVPKAGDTECLENCYCIIEIADERPPFSLAGVGL